ncbi:MAG: hypothetical protein IJE05_05670 [Clostridia bacterium]|nr:hypothetical protein [Clostridia bacterium]
MEEIIFVTHNKGKAKSAEKYFKNLKISTYDFELDEPRSDDLKEIATAKVKQAYKVVGKPCMALDTGFFIDELNGFPRAFKKQGEDRKEKWSDLWYVFKPKGFEKTLAEMNEQEREDRRKIDGSYSAMEKFAEWYQNEKIK